MVIDTEREAARFGGRAASRVGGVAAMVIAGVVGCGLWVVVVGMRRRAGGRSVRQLRG